MIENKKEEHGIFMAGGYAVFFFLKKRIDIDGVIAYSISTIYEWLFICSHVKQKFGGMG